jgi:ubiquinone/menaquinone biosynthesis C-methylase UbiE
MEGKFDPKNAFRLHDERRKKLLPAEEILITLGLREGMNFIDVGCGSGYFTIPASKIVGKNGKVYAIDVQQEMLEILKQKGVPENVVTLLAKSDYDFPVEDETGDFTLCAFVLHENHDPIKFLEEVKRITKSKGKIVILEWKKQVEDWGPPYEDRVSQEEVLRYCNKVGLSVHDYGEINKSHYKVVCTK